MVTRRNVSIQIIFLVISLFNTINTCVNCEESRTSGSVQFVHETCQHENISGLSYDTFYSVDPFVKETDVIELLIRFKGLSDAHLILTQDANDSVPFYLALNESYITIFQIVMGSYENTQSEIRKSDWVNSVFKLHTQGIMSEHQYRGFLVRYLKQRGELWVYSEGSEMPLLHWQDSNPVSVRYFSFSAYYNKSIQVAFNCKAIGEHEILKPFKASESELEIDSL